MNTLHNKVTRRIAVFSLSILVLLFFSIAVCATETELEIKNQIHDVDRVLERMKLEFIDEPTTKTSFSCFDVNAQGDYVLGFEKEKQDYLLVYSSAGEYLYGFSILDNGKFGVTWAGENLNLHRARSGLIITIDRQGNGLGIVEIEDSADNHVYLRRNVFANQQQLDGKTYTAKHWLYNNKLLHWGYYQELVQVSESGEEVVLYSCMDRLPSFLGMILGAFAITLLLAAFIMIYHKERKSANNHTTHGNST